MTTHRMVGTPTYGSWCHMKQRCLNPKMTGYQYLGGRGITVCDRWLKFEFFLEDMGLRPEGLFLGRINNDGDYEPDNCRWVTRTELRNGQRPRRLKRELPRKIGKHEPRYLSHNTQIFVGV